MVRTGLHAGRGRRCLSATRTRKRGSTPRSATERWSSVCLHPARQAFGLRGPRRRSSPSRGFRLRASSTIAAGVDVRASASTGDFVHTKTGAAAFLRLKGPGGRSNDPLLSCPSRLPAASCDSGRIKALTLPPQSECHKVEAFKKKTSFAGDTLWTLVDHRTQFAFAFRHLFLPGLPVRGQLAAQGWRVRCGNARRERSGRWRGPRPGQRQESCAVLADCRALAPHGGSE